MEKKKFFCEDNTFRRASRIENLIIEYERFMTCYDHIVLILFIVIIKLKMKPILETIVKSTFRSVKNISQKLPPLIINQKAFKCLETLKSC